MDPVTWQEKQVIYIGILCFAFLILVVLLELYSRSRNKPWKSRQWNKPKWRKKHTNWNIGLLLLLLSLPSLCFCSENFIVENFEFSENVNEYFEAMTIVPFNFTSGSSNVTLFITYENKLSGVKTTDCYATRYTIFVDSVIVASKTFQSEVQEFDITVPITVNFNLGEQHYGELRLLGTAEKGKPFYGTLSIGFENEPSGGGFPDVFGFLQGTWWIFTMVIGTSIIAIIVKRKRRKGREED